MLKSMYSGVSGLRSHQTMMDVIGNNIANVNTYGYKASRATFKDIYYQTLNAASSPTKKGGNAVSGGTNPNQIGYGVAVNTIDKMMTQSGFSFTDNGLDVAISGEGFFQVQTPDGSKLYTRAGILDIDADGNLVDAAGNFVLGVNSNISHDKDITKAATGSTMLTNTNTNIKFSAGTANTGGGVTVSIAHVAGAESATWAGNALTLNLLDGKEYSQADLQALINGAAGAPAGIGGIKVETDGKVKGDVAMAPSNITLQIPDKIVSDVYATHKDPNSGSMDPNTNKINILDQFNKTLAALGEPAARNDDFKSINISKSGEIIGNHAKWGPVVLGRLDIATFSNPRALEQSGNNYYAETSNSGTAQAVIPGTEGGGALAPAALELSNVDLSKEFSNMITTQRGFQANSRIITVSDEMLQELVNLKR